MFSLVVLFYLADVCNGIHFACNTILILIAILACVFLLALMAMACNDYCEDGELKEKVLSWKSISRLL